MRDLDNLENVLNKLDTSPTDIVLSLHEYHDKRFDDILSNLVDNKERDNNDEITSE